jgi:hypothetical protein
MLYTATGNRARGFTLADDTENILGTIGYTGWFSRNARLVLYSNDAYTIDVTGFWMRSFDILHAEIKTGAIKINLRGRVTISLNGSSYLYQRVGFFGRGFALYDAAGLQLATVQQRYDWKKFGFIYEIDWDAGSPSADMLILMLVIVYASSQLRVGARSVH